MIYATVNRFPVALAADKLFYFQEGCFFQLMQCIFGGICLKPES